MSPFPTAARSLALSPSDQDPLHQLAYDAIADRATEAFEIALHYQSDRSPESCREALHNALAVAASGFVAAGLMSLSEDPGLALTPEQEEFITDRARELDLDVVENLTGANGTGAGHDERAGNVERG
ncbi:hypothetical protein ACSNOH_18450 [Streptomyces sp. URMC 127]|uniref:hypothetical protein n=1 Tax=Streptomyces sp. URMC 127 TaxID=3423402 RepID=UPI003F1B52A1